MQFTPCQTKAFHLLESNANVFLTGAAGTGKSFLLRCFLQDKPLKSHPVLASTGTAALLVDGRTFHSFFGLGILEGGMAATVSRVLNIGTSLKRIRNAECIVIDEVSMLSGETLATAEEIARRARENDAPWGGLRIIAVGDFAQLPPVQPGNTEKDWGFMHPVWTYTGFQPIYLQTPVRTTEPLLLSVLNSVREGNVTPEVSQFLEDRRHPEGLAFEGTRLYPRRAAADAYNRKRLATLPTDQQEFPTVYTGDGRGIEQLKKQCPIPEFLHLKVDALVMLRKNDTSFPYKYVNGTLGTVVSMTPNHLILRLMNDKTVDIEPEEFSLLDGNGKKRAGATNFPVMLAWATTIHKAQGASIDRLMVNISGLWESGHAYVALSRAKSEEGLHIEHWEEQSIFIDPHVQRLYEEVLDEWSTASEKLPDTLPNFELKKGGRPKAEAKVPNHKQTETLLKKKLPLEEIANVLGWKEGTIVGHIEKLVREEVDVPDFEYIRPEHHEFQVIQSAFEDHGTEYLVPVFEKLRGRYTYEQLRLVRLFLL